MSSIFYHTQDSFAEEIFSLLGKGRLHAKRLYAHFMQKGTLENFTVEPQATPLLQSILQHTSFQLPEHCVAHSQEGTTKFLIKLSDGLECETVLIPMRFRTTLCISSQVGCKMGCAFCETGKMGLLRSLTTEEIVSQVFIAVHILKKKVDNIVFMGMGEPLDNLEAVLRAIEVLTCSSGLQFGPSKITVSTSGLVDQIDLFASKVDPAICLAVSVNAPNDAIRNKIMPVNRKWNMQELKGAMERFCSKERRQILVEYVLIKGVNDSLEHAQELGDYLQGLSVKINLIAYNSQSRERFTAPDQESIEAFLASLRAQGFLTLLRKTKGQKIMAACGQLGNLQLRKAHRQTLLSLPKETI